MNRLILGLSLAIMFAALVFAQNLPISEVTPGGVAIVDSWQVNDLLDQAVTADGEDSSLQTATHLSGFTLTRGYVEALVHQIEPSGADEEPEYEVTFAVVPPELWFIVSGAAGREIASISIQEDGTVLEKTRGIAIPESLGTGSNLRLSMQETPTPFDPPFDTSVFEPVSVEGELTPAEVLVQGSHPILHVIDPASEIIFTTTTTGSPATGAFNASEYDPRGPMNGGRGPADTAGYPLETQDFDDDLIFHDPDLGLGGQPGILELLDDPGATYSVLADGITAEGFLTIRYPLSGADEFPYDDVNRILVLDREAAVTPSGPPYDGQLLTTDDRAQLRMLQSGATFDEVPLFGQLNNAFHVASAASLETVFPFGGTMDYDASTETILEVLRSGGLEDVVIRTGELADGDMLSFNGGISTLFSNYNLNSDFPVRIQEVEFDSDGSLWLLTERLADDDGQIYNDLYHISLGQTETFNGGFPLPVLPTPPNRAVRGDYDDDGVTDATNIVTMVNALNGDPPPPEDPNEVGGDLLFRVDVDANGFFDALDREQIITMNLTGRPGQTPLSNAPLSQQTPLAFDFGAVNLDAFDTEFSQIYDIEVVDHNGDGFPEVAALFSDSTGGTFLWRSGSLLGTNEASFEPVIPMDFEARDMVWLNLDDEGPLDVAMINNTNAQPGVLRLYRNLDPGGIEFQLQLPAGVSPREIVAGNFNADTRTDILVGDNTGVDNLQIYINHSPFVFSQTTWSVDGTPLGIALGQIDISDPRANNLAVASNFNSSLSIYEAQGDSQVLSDKVDTAQQGVDAFFGRFASAGDLLDPRDVVVIGGPGVASAPDIEIFQTVGPGTVESVRQLVIFDFINARDGAIGDFNLDGADDIVLIGQSSFSSSGRLAIYATSLLNPSFSSALNDGFADFRFPFGGGLFGDVEVGDLDADRDLDLVFSIINTPGGAGNGILMLPNVIETVVRVPTQH